MPSSPSRAARTVVSAVPLVLAACRRREVHEPTTRVRVSTHLAGILENLDPVRPITAGELARRLNVTPGTLSLQLTRLIKLRLVARGRDAADVAITTTFGPNTLESFRVWTDEVVT